MQIFIASLFTLAKKLETQMSINLQMNKTTVGSYSSTKRDKLLTNATQINIKGSMLSERTQKQKTTDNMYPFFKNSVLWKR